ncbi:unnamed protein product [Microthlaspi erraticum]|uniref:Uncharacterized protein n=1 Tax=Microthlaspi erraticum TaxID=1685480 RepID=A0A6D2IPF8_9BRAS|nr:unnamed protein product [Microthlaspi erraticum]
MESWKRIQQRSKAALLSKIFFCFATTALGYRKASSRGYSEVSNALAAGEVAVAEPEPKFQSFTGSGRRLDGLELEKLESKKKRLRRKTRRSKNIHSRFQSGCNGGDVRGDGGFIEDVKLEKI